MIEPLKIDKIKKGLARGGVVVRGDLYRQDAVAALVQDMLEIETPEGTIIGIGWYPEHDSTGHYVVEVYSRANPLPTARYKVRRPFDALRVAIAILERLSARAVSISNS